MGRGRIRKDGTVYKYIPKEKRKQEPKPGQVTITDSDGKDVTETLIGAQGEPWSIDDIISRKLANPGFSWNDFETSHNCQRVVYAAELLRRGYDVKAQGREPGYDFLAYGGHKTTFKGQEWEDVSGKQNKTVAKNIEKQMADWGNGARAIVKIKWSKGNAGHVFNIEQVDGKIVAYDAQDSTYYPSLLSALKGTSPGWTELSRVDHLNTVNFGQAKSAFTKINRNGMRPAKAG